MARPNVSFGRAAPTIPVSDMEQAIAFYRDVIGLSVTFTNGSPVGFAILKQGDAEIHLTHVRGHQGGPWNVAHLLVSDATTLHDRCCQHGTRIVRGLRDHDFGLRAFVFADPDGNRIDVGESLPR